MVDIPNTKSQQNQTNQNQSQSQLEQQQPQRQLIQPQQDHLHDNQQHKHQHNQQNQQNNKNKQNEEDKNNSQRKEHIHTSQQQNKQTIDTKHKYNKHHQQIKQKEDQEQYQEQKEQTNQQQQEPITYQKRLQEIKQENWIENSPYLYNTLYTQHLIWPSLTVQWLPQKTIIKEEGICKNKVLYATNTSGQEQEYVILGKLNVQIEVQKQKGDNSISQSKQNIKMKMKPIFQSKIKICAMIKHEGGINRARYNPFHPQIIATKSSNAGVYIFNCKQYSKNGQSSENALNICLNGHEEEGFGLCWNPKKDGILLSGANDGNILIWDVNKIIDNSSLLQFYRSFQQSNVPINDVAFHKRSPDVFAAGDDDGNVNFYDMRQQHKFPKSGKHHKGEVYSIDFSSKNPYRYVTGGSDKIVSVWDMRNNTKQLVRLQGHLQSITKVEFSPKSSNIIWSSSSDANLIKWDLRLDRSETPQKDQMNKPSNQKLEPNIFQKQPTKLKPQVENPTKLQKTKNKPKQPLIPRKRRQLKDQTSYSKQCRFVHAGHQNPIVDFNIHPLDSNKIVTTDENNQMHFLDPVVR